MISCIYSVPNLYTYPIKCTEYNHDNYDLYHVYEQIRMIYM